MLYTWDWHKEFDDYSASKVPSHRLFGAAHLPAEGVDVVICAWRFVPRWARKRQIWKVYQALWALRIQSRVDCVIATTEASALPLLALTALRVMRRPVVVFAVAALSDKFVFGCGGRLRRALLQKAAHIVVFASSQVQPLQSLLALDSGQVTFVPFGVDVDFFEPRDASGDWDVVAAGTNQGKDYPTLVRALRTGERCLIVTDSWNQRKIAATRTDGELTVDQDVPIEALANHYLSARRVVIPLREVPYSTGQTVLLENLALGRPVIVSEVDAVRDYVSSDVAKLVPPGDATALRAALDREAPAFVPAAAAWVRERFSARRFAGNVAALCKALDA